MYHDPMSRLHVVLAATGLVLSAVPACFLIGEGTFESTSGGGDPGTGGDGGTGTVIPAGGGPQGGGGGAPPNSGGGGSGGAPGCDDGYVCVPEITAGSFVRKRNDGETCDGVWTTPTTYVEPVKVGCLPCSCDPPPTGTCDTASIRFYQFGDCSDMADVANLQAGCGNLLQTYDAYRLPPSAPSVEACPPVGGGDEPLINPVTLCGLDRAPMQSCGAGMLCVPAGSGELCNLLPQGDSCAAGYGSPVDLATIAMDDRNCTCGCTPSTGQTCSATTMDVYDSNNCSGASLGTVTDNNQCTNIQDTSGSIFVTPGTWSGGSCEALPTTGDVTFGTTQTVCCLQ